MFMPPWSRPAQRGRKSTQKPDPRQDMNRERRRSEIGAERQQRTAEGNVEIYRARGLADVDAFDLVPRLVVRANHTGVESAGRDDQRRIDVVRRPRCDTSRQRTPPSRLDWGNDTAIGRPPRHGATRRSAVMHSSRQLL